MRPAQIIFLVLGLLAAVHSPEAGATGMDVEPFHVLDQGPFSLIFGLPPAEGGKLVPAGRLDARFVFDIANSDSGEWLPGETVELDGETQRYTLAFRYGLSDWMELGVDVPYLYISEGTLDGFMDDFHKALTRTTAQKAAGKYRLVYSHSRNGVIDVDVQDSTSGFGDILLSAAVPLRRANGAVDRPVALRAALKLPTGDPDTLMGSGGADFSLRVAASDNATLSAANITLYGAGGVLFMGKGDVLPEQQRNFAWFGTAGFGWSPLGWLALKLQLDAHTPFYRDTEMVVLKSNVFQLTGGCSFALPRDTTLDIGLSDKIVTETSPDVALHLAVRTRF